MENLANPPSSLNTTATPTTKNARKSIAEKGNVRRKLQMKANTNGTEHNPGPVLNSDKEKNARKCGGMVLRKRGQVSVYHTSNESSTTTASSGETDKDVGKNVKQKKAVRVKLPKPHIAQNVDAVAAETGHEENGASKATDPLVNGGETSNPQGKENIFTNEQQQAGSDDSSEEESSFSAEDVSKMSASIALRVQSSNGNFQPTTGPSQMTTANAQQFRTPIQFGNARGFPMTPARFNQPIYPCVVCEYQFPTKGALKNHLECHEGRRPFACPICLWACETDIQLLEHWTKHSNEAVFKCGGCGKSYKTKRGITNHQILKKCSTPTSLSSRTQKS